MSLDTKLSDLIRDIYCADQGELGWNVISAEILRQTGACSGLCTVVDLKCGQIADFRFLGRESSGVADAMAEYPDRTDSDPSLSWAMRNPAAGFCASDQTMPGEDYLASEWVKWNKSRMGATHWYVCYSAPGARFSHSLSIHIPHSQGAATDDQVSKFRMLFCHLENAAWLHRAPRDEDGARTWLLLDGNARVVMTSPAADALLASGDGLTLRDGQLVPFNGRLDVALSRCFARTAECFETGALPAALWIDRPNGRRPWLLTVRPLVTSFAGLAKVTSGFHVHLSDPRAQFQPTSSLSLLFDLSPREAEVMELLARGHSLSSLAEALSISANTAKVHLQAIFSKTRTHRQADLLQLCAQIERQVCSR